MMNALYSAATGMMAMQTGMDLIANNLANVNTSGYKSSRLTFEDLLYQQLGETTSARRGAQVGMGVTLGRTQLEFTQGDMRETSNKTSMAIEGNGFFQVQLPNGEVGYTRDGNFLPDGNGQLVISSGYTLEPPVVVPVSVDPQSIMISQTGRVTGKINGADVILGQVELANFVNPAGLFALGSNTFAATVNSGPAQVGIPGQSGLGVIKQGYVEGSNVSVMNEMVDMISTQRAFESVSKALSSSDEMLGMANGIRR
jgi:flagellar basal-body rod protein FlgG